MTPREAEIQAFLERAGFGRSRRSAIVGDASARQYERIHRRGETLVLMNAPPGEEGETPRFVAMTRFLAGLDLSVPQIVAEDAQRGLLLLEDFGEDLLAVSMHGRPMLEERAYRYVAEILETVRGARMDLAPVLPEYDIDFALDEAALAYEWYLPAISGQTRPELEAGMREALRAALLRVRAPGVVVLRDVHAENLFWLENRQSFRKVGLIDYQGAKIGHPIYDLVSLLHDARRDIDPKATAAALEVARAGFGPDWPDMQAAFAVWSLQRNLKVLGLFARAALRDGKPGYLRHIPRTWGYVQSVLEHPLCRPLAATVGPLPPPDRRSLDWIRARA